MASARERLSELGRPIRPIMVKSRDDLQEIEIYYQRPTTLTDRMNRDAMLAEYNEALKSFDKIEDGETETLREKYVKEFEKIGNDKCASFIVSSDRAAIRVDAIREMGREPLPLDATPEQEAEWMAEYRPIFEGLIAQNIELVKAEPLEELAKKCVDIQINQKANDRAYAIYRLRLMLVSLFEQDEKDPSKYNPIFKTIQEIEELLSPETIDDVSAMISEEVRKASELPLKLALTP